MFKRKKNFMKKVILFLNAIIFMIVFSSSYAYMSPEEMEKRLNELLKIIKLQQKEIERLKKELEMQKKIQQQILNQQIKRKELELEKKVKAQQKTIEKIKKSIPSWIKKIKISGDLRLRYEGIFNRKEKQKDGSLKDIKDRQRYRFRARLFLDAPISDEISAHIMLCTNQDKNREATTANQNFSDDFNDKGIYIHRAYAVYKPKWLKGLELGGGKFKNTFLHTDIIWDPDVNPEGFYERYQYLKFKTFQPFIHLGQMVVNEVNKGKDAYLYIYQLGSDINFKKFKWTIAGSYYNWYRLEASKWLKNAEYKGGGGNTYVLKNGELDYAYDYDLWEVISFLKFKVKSIPVKLIFDYVENFADHVPSSKDSAYYLGFVFGSSKKKGDFSLSYKYAYIENDAVIGSLNDQNFYGANRKGHKIKLRYRLLDNLEFALAYFHTKPVHDWDVNSPTFKNNKIREREDRLQSDVILKF